MQKRVLIVDDEPDILEFVSYNLRAANYIVETANNGLEALSKIESFKPEFVLLDMMMPQMDGIATCKKARELPNGKNLIIVFLSARAEEYVQIEALQAGADDYITKPIRPKLLTSKIDALIKRVEEINSTKSRNNSNDSLFIIDSELHCVIIDGKNIPLARKEFKLLSLLHSSPEKVFSRDEIFAAVWDSDVIVGDRTIDVHIRKLREKIGDEYIVTLKGVGYKLAMNH